MPDDLPLHPDIRSLYGGSLRPPPGTIFDAGVATTFTLDIETALAVPVTLVLFASEDRDELLKSPLALLEGLERTADRLAIFCEAGRIQAQPAPQSRLCTLLERLITEVAAPGTVRDSRIRRGRVLRAFRPAEVPPRDAGQRAAEQRIDRARRALIDAGLAPSCTAQRDEEGGQALWKVVLRAGRSVPLDGLGSATCWPITLGEPHAHDVLKALRDGRSIEIGTMPLIDVTRFVAFRLADATHEETTALFALGIRIDGLPTTRHRAVLRWVLDSREAFLRYLRLLLADAGDPLIAQAADPLDVVAGHAETLSYRAMRAALASRLEPHLRRLQSAADESSELDTWQWTGPAVLDALAGNRSRAWLEMDALQIRLDPPAG